MIYGNLLGSNLFNMAILALDDLLYLQAPLLTTAKPSHMVSANAAMAMTVFLAFLARVPHKFGF